MTTSTNFLTEEEAKTKWCPEVRTGWEAGAGAVSVNRDVRSKTEGGVLAESHEDSVFRCVASACMAWRAATNGKGYCGKFGRPEQ